MKRPWFDAVAAIAQGEHGQVAEDGTSCSFDCALLNVHALLRVMPDSFELAFDGYTPLCDQFGQEVDEEVRYGVYTSEPELAMLRYYDHWQAGFGASLMIFDTREAFEAAIAQTTAELRDEIEIFTEDE